MDLASVNLFQQHAGRLARLKAALAVAALGLGAILGSPTRAAAGLVIAVNPSSAPSGGMGAFDVILEYTDGDTEEGPLSIAGFSIGVGVDPATGVQFTGATTLTTSFPYIFGFYRSAPDQFAYDLDGDDGVNPFPGTAFKAIDNVMDPATESVTLMQGQAVGLAHVTYSLANATSAGPFTVSLLPDYDSVSDPNGNSLTFTESNGSISVTMAAVPEPATWLLGSIAAGMTLARARYRSRRGPRPQP